MLHRREYRPEYVTKLCCACYQPVEARAVQRHAQIIHPSPHMGVRHHIYITLKENECCSVQSKVPYNVHKLVQEPDGTGMLFKEINFELLEERNGDLRKKRFQVSASALEPKPAEVRKCYASHGRCIRP